MPPRKSLTLTLVAIAALTLSACSTDAPDNPAAEPSGDGHGFIEGAEEVSEPPLHLMTMGAGGSIKALDLLDESWTDIGAIGAVTDTVTDGRFVFAIDAASGTVTVVDSGMWTRNHEDHFHYYRASPRIVGSVEGTGAATISPGSAATGVFFADSGSGMMLDNAALAEGEIVERLRVEGQPHAGSMVQLGTVTLATEGEGGAATNLHALDADGEVIPGTDTSCADAGTPITTSVGVAFPCSDDVVLATDQGDGIRFERIPYPESDAPPARSFAAREGRPSVAGLAGDHAIWMLDTRERRLVLLPTDVPLRQVTAVDDEAGHLLGLTDDGRVAVFSGAGSTLAVTGPLISESLASPELLRGVSLVADQHRAYLNAPAEQKLYEIDFADSARIARSFTTADEPRFFAETGR